MNINNLFPQYSSTGNNGSLKYTDRIPLIPITNYPFPDSYYLGYMKYWFNWQKTTQATHNIDTGEIIFTDITDYDEYPSLGYYLNGGLSIDIPSNYFYDESQTTPHYVNSILSDSYSNYLVNNFHPQATSMRSLFLRFAFLGYSTNGNGIPQNEISLNISQFLSFLNGNLSLTITNTWTGTQYTLSRNDFTNDCYYEIDSTHRIILCDGYFSSTGYYDDNNTLYNSLLKIFSQSNYKILDTSLKCISSGEYISPSSSSGICTLRYNGSAYIYYNRYAKNIANNDTTGGVITSPIIGHVAGRIKLSDLSYDGAFALCDEDITSQTYASTYYSAGEYLIKVFWNYTFDEIYKSASVYRWTTSDVYGFSDEVVYYPTFNPDDMNEFTLGLQTGTQSELESLLPLWYRLDNAQASEYTDSSKPSPEDEDDTDPEPDIETGVIVSNNFSRPFSIANQFVTTYVMTGAQLSNLGRILWTSFNDDTVTMDMVENFWANVQQATGTWDISAVMNFIISLTMFPFDVTNLLTSTSLQSASELFLGTGKLGLDIKGTNNLYVANYAVGIADLGTVSIPETYGDYRDYVNTVISVYLPYCGTVQLNPSDVVGKSISCKYAIDINSGECTAFLILVDNNVERYNLAIEKGMCGFSIPITSTNSAQVKTRLENNMLKSGSAMLSMLQGGLNVFETALNGDAFDIGGSVLGFQQSRISSKMLENSFLSQSGIGCNYISGATGFSDLACPSTAYVQIKRGIYSKPMHYKSTVGYSTNAKEYGKISNFSGYIECVNADVSGMTCTEEEKSKIKSLLESGVYV